MGYIVLSGDAENVLATCYHFGIMGKVMNFAESTETDPTMSVERGSRGVTQAVGRDGHLSSTSETPQFPVKMVRKWGEAKEDGGTEEQNQGETLVTCFLSLSSVPAESP